MTAAWDNFDAEAQKADGQPILELFAAEPDRLQRLTLDAAGLFVDLSKQSWTKALFEAALGLATAADLDAARARLFGGEVVADYSDETWEWDGSQWLLRATGLPSGRPSIQHAISYDAKRGRVVMLGGVGIDDDDQPIRLEPVAHVGQRSTVTGAPFWPSQAAARPG